MRGGTCADIKNQESKTNRFEPYRYSVALATSRRCFAEPRHSWAWRCCQRQNPTCGGPYLEEPYNRDLRALLARIKTASAPHDRLVGRQYARAMSRLDQLESDAEGNSKREVNSLLQQSSIGRMGTSM